MNQPRILYCHCAYAQVVPKDVKEAVLRRLSEAGVAFEAVADLCEMSARHDRTLQRLSSADSDSGGAIKIAACFPRAVKWLFAAAGAPLNAQSTEVLNMRVRSAEEIVNALLAAPLQPNLPVDKTDNAGTGPNPSSDPAASPAAGAKPA